MDNEQSIVILCKMTLGIMTVSTTNKNTTLSKMRFSIPIKMFHLLISLRKKV